MQSADEYALDIVEALRSALAELMKQADMERLAENIEAADLSADHVYYMARDLIARPDDWFPEIKKG